jgi:alpha-L-fucosidase 2
MLSAVCRPKAILECGDTSPLLNEAARRLVEKPGPGGEGRGAVACYPSISAFCSRPPQLQRRWIPNFCFSALTLLAWLSLASLAAGQTIAPASSPTTLWFAQPAVKWTEALPIGNGRLGAMIFGGPTDERIQFNEDTLWTGHPHDYANTNALQALPAIRALLAAGQNREAGALAKSNFLGTPSRQKAYQPFGDLRLHFSGADNSTDYRRSLDLESGVASVTFRAQGAAFRREAFASHPDQAVILHFTSDQAARVSFTLQMTSPHPDSETHSLNADTLVLDGQVETGGLRFESRVRVMNTGGKVTANGQTITVENADAVTLVLVAATSFNNFQDISADPARRCAHDLERDSQRTYALLLAAHQQDYQNLFQRVRLDLGRTDLELLPTDERLKQVKVSGLSADPGLAALYFQYGRYLLMSSSRAGGQPANLQGLWNESLDPPWESKWTLNINCEMNYWPVEVCNLSECHGPLFGLIDDLAVSGARTAREQYGCRGWVVHHNTDLWRGSAPINGIDGVWPTGGAWLCQHLWEHYCFTGDKTFLAHAYPEMKEAALFFVDALVHDPKTGWLVTSPSYSPEQGELTTGPTMDNQLIRALLNHTIAAAALLKQDAPLAAQLAAVRDQLPPNQIGSHGQLQEWLGDVDRPNNNHRHMSPLWALYPGNDLTPADPKVFAAARLLLQWRGDGSTGWSYAWRMPLWARVGDGDTAFRELNSLFQRKTLPNLLDLCGPFQIDGNFGATAGIAEMLLQSHQVVARPGQDAVRLLELLPALPKNWPAGSVNGLCARDGFVLDETWRGGVLTRAVLTSKLGRPCLLRSGPHEITLATQPGGRYTFDGNLTAN